MSEDTSRPANHGDRPRESCSHHDARGGQRSLPQPLAYRPHQALGIHDSATTNLEVDGAEDCHDAVSAVRSGVAQLHHFCSH
jgi:hypothetical protein